MNIGDSDSSLENTIELGLVEQLWVLSPNWFKLNGHFFISFDVGAMVDVSKGATTKLP